MASFIGPVAVIRRGFGHSGEIWLVTQVLSSFGIWSEPNRIIEANLGAFALFTIAGTALYELLEAAIRPDMQRPCNEDSPMLPFKDEK